VDEADSLLIDEARVPLVIAGSVGREMSAAPRLALMANGARRAIAVNERAARRCLPCTAVARSMSAFAVSRIGCVDR